MQIGTMAVPPCPRVSPRGARLLRAASAAVLALAVCAPASAQGQAQAATAPRPAATAPEPAPHGVPVVGFVKRIEGQASLRRAGAPEQALASGMPLREGDTIVTARNGRVGLTLIDDTRLAVGPGTELVLRQVAFDSATHDGNMLLQLWRGTVNLVSGLIAHRASDRVRIETPQAVLGVRGTDFIVDLGDGAGDGA